MGIVSTKLFFIGAPKTFFKTVMENYKTLIPLWIMAGIICLSCFPFQSLQFFDEHTFLAGAQSIIERNSTSLCNLNISGKCLESGYFPHGLGGAAIYALLYSTSSKVFLVKITIFNFLCYLANSLLIFKVTKSLFNSKETSLMASALYLAMPFHIIYATSLMPETFGVCLFLLGTWALLKCSLEGMTLYVCLICMLASIRAEYITLLILVLFFMPKRLEIKIGSTLSVLAGIITLGITTYYLNQYQAYKLSENLSFSFSNFNLSYLWYFFKSIPQAIILLLGVILFLIRKTHSKETIIFLSSSFLLTLMYSFFSFQEDYRFMLIASVLYVIGISRSLISLDFKFKKSLLIILLLSLAGHAFFFKRDILNSQKSNSDLIALIQEFPLPTNGFIIYPMGYLSSLYQRKNFSVDTSKVHELRKNGFDVYYLDNPFMTIEQFREGNSVDVEVVSHNNSARIYRLK